MTFTSLRKRENIGIPFISGQNFVFMRLQALGVRVLNYFAST
jgi:hypothetical protein